MAADVGIQDQVLQYCKNCGAANRNHNTPEGHRHRCHQCGSFVRRATPKETHLLGKRMEQQVLHDQGYVTVGGYTPGVDGPDYGEDSA